MKPTVPELLAGVAEVLASDVVDQVADPVARSRLGDAIAILRRLAAVVPNLHAWLRTDGDDIAATLLALASDPGLDLAPELRMRIETVTAGWHALDRPEVTVDHLHDGHQALLGALDAVVAACGRDGLGPTPLRALLERVVRREHALGASIAGR